ncbi:tetratricopeptide repeat protein, partial [Lipingzhangella sp. LS1_29]|nr:tetratricopeptide repeat protein [Lipingzhangella rawalii]
MATPLPAVLEIYGFTVPWLTSGAAFAAAVAALVSGVLVSRADRRAQQDTDRAVARRRSGVVSISGRVPRVEERTDLRAWGVHPAVALEDAQPAMDDPPVYVPRDIDTQLRARLDHSGFVLVVGDSTAGKTRCAAEAVR